jgi:hypothetical protein
MALFGRGQILAGGGDAEFSPDNITGLAIWHDASDPAGVDESEGAGFCNQWTDLSGNGEHSTTTGTARPETGTRTINSLNVLDFVSTDVLTGAAMTTTGAAGISIFVVLQQDSTAAATQGVLYLVNNVGTDDLLGVMIELRTNKYALAWGEGDASASAVGKEWKALHQATGTAETTAAHLITALLDSSAQVMRIDGAAITLTAFATSGSPSFLANLAGADLDMVIGVRDGNGNPYNGAIGEILVYDSVLTGTNLTDVETYLMDKWGL